jgi:hypothetical protein
MINRNLGLNEKEMPMWLRSVLGILMLSLGAGLLASGAGAPLGLFLLGIGILATPTVKALRGQKVK